MTEMRRYVLRLLDAGDGGLVVELGQDIDEATNAAVMALADRLTETAPEGILEIIPTYRSVLVQFDPLRLAKPALAEAVHSAWSTSQATQRNASLWHIPVCYGGQHGADLGAVAQAHKLDEAEVVARHAGATYRIYMIGFAPGFAYLGGLDRCLHTSRRPQPRLKTPPRSVSIGGMQTAVSPPIEIPSGWHMLGQTAVRTYNPLRKAQPFLFGPGDYLRFHPIDEQEYDRQLQAVESGALVAEREDFHG